MCSNDWGHLQGQPAGQEDRFMHEFLYLLSEPRGLVFVVHFYYFWFDTPCFDLKTGSGGSDVFGIFGSAFDKTFPLHPLHEFDHYIPEKLPDILCLPFFTLSVLSHKINTQYSWLKEVQGNQKNTDWHIIEWRTLPHCMAGGIPHEAVGAFVGVLIYSVFCFTLCMLFFCLLLTYGEKWSCWYLHILVHHSVWPTDVTILTGFTTTSTLSSIIQQVHYATAWIDIKQAQFEKAVKNLSNPPILSSGAAEKTDVVLFSIRECPLIPGRWY